MRLFQRENHNGGSQAGDQAWACAQVNGAR